MTSLYTPHIGNVTRKNSSAYYMGQATSRALAQYPLLGSPSLFLPDYGNYGMGGIGGLGYQSLTSVPDYMDMGGILMYGTTKPYVNTVPPGNIFTMNPLSYSPYYTSSSYKNPFVVSAMPFGTFTSSSQKSTANPFVSAPQPTVKAPVSIQNYSVPAASIQPRQTNPALTTIQANKPVTPTPTPKPTATAAVTPAPRPKPTATAAPKPVSVNLGTSFLATANKYENCKESDNSHLKFCVNPECRPINSGEWCTDFVTYIVGETYRNKGLSLPSWVRTHDVETLKNRAIQHNSFIRTNNRSNKGEFIGQNIKPGDILILNENNSSHTGFVTGVDPQTGIFTTIEGNRDDKVTRWKYRPDDPRLSGFIRLSA